MRTESCGPGTVWDGDSGLHRGLPADTNFDGCVQLNDLLYARLRQGFAKQPRSCGDPLEYQGYDYELCRLRSSAGLLRT